MAEEHSATDAQSEFIEDVLRLIEEIPSGKVLTYGRIARVLERGGARQVGNILAVHGHGVPWWRVVRANGTLPDHLMIDALEHWYVEGTPMRRGTVHIAEALWDVNDA